MSGLLEPTFDPLGLTAPAIAETIAAETAAQDVQVMLTKMMLSILPFTAFELIMIFPALFRSATDAVPPLTWAGTEGFPMHRDAMESR
jgi:hypothetical protein